MNRAGGNVLKNMANARANEIATAKLNINATYVVFYLSEHAFRIADQYKPLSRLYTAGTPQYKEKWKKVVWLCKTIEHVCHAVVLHSQMERVWLCKTIPTLEPAR